MKVFCSDVAYATDGEEGLWEKLLDPNEMKSFLQTLRLVLDCRFLWIESNCGRLGSTFGVKLSYLAASPIL